MTITQKICRKYNLFPIHTFRVRSRSDPGKYHKVKEYADGHWECDCEGFLMARKHGKDCRHIRIAKNYLNGLKYGGENYKQYRSKSGR